MNAIQTFIANIIKGIVIGIANIIPGVSGATFALILGVYEKIINILTKFDNKLITLIKQRETNKIKEHISLHFLIPLGIGIIISFLLVSELLNYLFINFETQTWAYFFGIIFVSIFYIAKYTDKWGKQESLCFIVGLCTALTLLFIEPAVENDNLFFIFICGMLGIIGMLIPGLSGSYLLMLLGNYKLIFITTVQKITNTTLIAENNYFYLQLIIAFLLGKIAGILLFSRLIKWLLKYFKNKTFATLSGFVAGSLIYIWPWQTKIENAKLIETLSYPTFKNYTDIYAILFIFIGAMTIIIIEKIAKKYKDV